MHAVSLITTPQHQEEKEKKLKRLNALCAFEKAPR